MRHPNLHSVVTLVLAGTVLGLAADPAGAFSVTGATATAVPADYTGPCPVTIQIKGDITTDGAGVVTYRWRHSPSAPYESVTFDAAGTKTVTTTRESDKDDFLQLDVETPNVIFACATWKVHCQRIVRPLPRARLVPSVARPGTPPPVLTNVQPTAGPPALNRDPGPITELLKLSNGVVAEIHTDVVLFRGGDGATSTPANGLYELADGAKLVVAGGKIVQRIASPAKH